MMWISYAVKHNVKVLDVDLNGYDRTFLPHCVFTCPSLKELNLQLRGDAWSELPDTIDLPSLRKLTLADVEVAQLSLDQIIARSPSLEDLKLEHCAPYFHLVDSKVLKSLTLCGLENGLPKFTVTAPHLIHFRCIDTPLENISWREWPCLESMHIEFSRRTFNSQYDYTGLILHAKRVKLLTGPDVKVMLEKVLPTCSVFENLEFLEIGKWSLIDSLYIILRFLQLSPRLQTLILTDKKYSQAEKGAGKDAMLNTEMTLQCSRLQTVIIQCSKNDSEIGTVVNAMVDNGVSLKTIHVTYHEDVMRRCFGLVTNHFKKQKKELDIHGKMLKENPEWADDSSYAGSESETSDDDYDDDEESWDDDDDDGDDESLDEVDDDESADNAEDESGDGDNDDDEIEDVDDDEIEDEDDDNAIEEADLDNNEHGDDDL